MGVAHVWEIAGRLLTSNRRAATMAVSAAVLACIAAVAGATDATRSDLAVPEATVAGEVRDEATGEPLPGAWVALTELERGVLTDTTGRYEIPHVPPGPQHVTVRFIGYAPRTLHALVPPSGRLEINVSLRPKPHRIHTVDVPAPVAIRGLDRADSAGFPDRERSIAAIRNDPLLTEPDVFQALDGGDVTMRPEEPSGINIQGGATDQTAYVVDGIPVFSPYHAAGLASAWNPDALTRLRLSTSPQLSTDPHTLAGVVEGITRTPADRIRGQGSVSTTQARLTLDGPIGSRGAGYLLSLRSGFAGLVFHKDESSHLKGETGDALGKVEADALGGRIRLTGYVSENDIDAAAIVASDQAASDASPRNTFTWESQSWGGEWRRLFGATSVRVQGWSAFGEAGSNWAALPGPIHMSSERRDEGLLAEIERATPRETVAGGVRAERSKTWYQLRSDSAAISDRRLDARTPVITGSARYARRLGRGSEGDLGAALAAAEGNLYLNPRAVLRWQAMDRFSITGSWVRSRQFGQSLRNPESVAGTVFPADIYIGSDAPGVPVGTSDRGGLAADFRPWPGARLSVQAYGRDSDGLLLVAPGEEEPYGTGVFTVGTGRARGISVEAVLSGARYAAFATYGYQDVRLEYGDSSYVPEHGARNLLEGGITAFPTAALSVRVGAAASWGRRTTIATGEFEWESCNLLDQGCEFSGSPHYIGDPLGGKAMPAYYRVDLGVRQHWHVDAWGRDFSFAIFGAVTNLLGTVNVLTYTRDPSTGVVSEVEMRPRSPLVLGLDWWF